MAFFITKILFVTCFGAIGYSILKYLFRSEEDQNETHEPFDSWDSF